MACEKIIRLLGFFLGESHHQLKNTESNLVKKYCRVSVISNSACNMHIPQDHMAKNRQNKKLKTGS